MLIKEFGSNEKPVLILIHGGGLNWWSWKAQIEALKNDYAIKVVILDGHGEDYETEFVSIENTAQKLMDYIHLNKINTVHGICGLSIGAQVVVEMLSVEPNLSENWLIESALVKPLGWINQLMAPSIALAYPLIKKRWYAQIQSKVLCVDAEDFESYYQDSRKMTLNSLKAMTLSNGNYGLKVSNLKTSKNVMIYVGSREPKIMIESAKLLSNAVPNSQLEILEGFKHGELSLVHREKYIEIIRSFQK